MSTKRPIRIVLHSSSSSSNSSANASKDLIIDSSSGESEELDLESDYDENISTISSSPKRLTARQRVLLHDVPSDQQHQDNVPLSFNRKKRHLTEEEMSIENEKSKKRKHQRDQKLEESKRATIDRLLMKQSSRSKKPGTTTNEEPLSTMLLSQDKIIFVSKKEGEYLIVPESQKDYFSSLANQPLKPLKCAVRGCSNAKKYTKLNGSPVCSLECYKKLK